MHKYVIFFLLFISKFSFSQIEISWQDLEDVEFSEVYVDEVDEYILFPNFGCYSKVWDNIHCDGNKFEEKN